MEVQLPPAELPVAKLGVATPKKNRPCPFVIVVDSAEQNPFSFQGIDGFIVNPGEHIVRQCLGRYPNSLGDYSLAGYVGRVAIERKSMEDAHSTILGYDSVGGTSHRGRFERELANLANIECAIVLVECSEEQFLDQAPEWEFGRRTAELNRKMLESSILAFQQDYGSVQWKFRDGRRDAEKFAFDYLYRFYDKHRTKKVRVQK